jgi:hypothetical protein
MARSTSSGKRVAIYALSDPRDGVIRYVGKASKLRRRLAQHCRTPADRNSHRANWLRALRRDGERPQLIILERCWEGEWPERERCWIANLKAEGTLLVNGTEGGDQPPAGMGNGRKGTKRGPWSDKLASLTWGRKFLRDHGFMTPEIEARYDAIFSRWHDLEKALGKQDARECMNLQLILQVLESRHGQAE